MLSCHCAMRQRLRHLAGHARTVDTHTYTHAIVHAQTETDRQAGRQARSNGRAPRSSPAAIWAWITCKDLGEDFAKLIATGLEGGKLPLHNCVKGVGEKKITLLGSRLDLCNICDICVCVCMFSITLLHPPIHHHHHHPPQTRPNAICPFRTN